MSDTDLTGDTRIGTQFPLFDEMEMPRSYTAVQLATAATAVSEPSRDAQPDMFGEEYFK